MKYPNNNIVLNREGAGEGGQERGQRGQIYGGRRGLELGW